MAARQVEAAAVATLGRFKGFLVADEGEGQRARWISIDRCDLVGAGDRLWIVASTGGRHARVRDRSINGTGARQAATVYRSIHGREADSQRWIRDRGIPRSARFRGEAINVIYQPIETDGTPRRPRRHEFKKPRPHLWATQSALYLHGGKFKITRFGIVG